MAELRYTLTLEIEQDGHVIRRMVESRDKLDNDCSDGEQTIGLLLSFVPQWVAADTGCSGLATLAHMSNYLPHDEGGTNLWKTLGRAYVDWGAAHEFDKGVIVLVMDRINKCDGMECDCLKKTRQPRNRTHDRAHDQAAE